MSKNSNLIQQKSKDFQPPVLRRYSSAIYYSLAGILLFLGLQALTVGIFLTGIMVTFTEKNLDGFGIFLVLLSVVFSLFMYLLAFGIFIYVFKRVKRGFFRWLSYSWYYELYPSKAKPVTEEDEKTQESKTTSTSEVESEKIKSLEAQIAKLQTQIERLSKNSKD